MHGDLVLEYPNLTYLKQANEKRGNGDNCQQFPSNGHWKDECCFLADRAGLADDIEQKMHGWAAA